MLLALTDRFGYRPDVDGLRAIAVGSVIAYHINSEWVPGGYVGVDVFFVISGFLITRLIWNELDEGCFTLGGFYLRRIRRIAPASILVTFVTLLAAIFLLQPSDIVTLARSAIWTVLSAANIYFWKYLDTSYFAEASDQQPLLHMWSLGVEEQFYLVWPALLLLLAATRRRHRLISMLLAIVIAVISFGWAEQTNISAPKFSYFMLPTRAGELMIGAILALLRLDGTWGARRIWSVGLREGCALAGFGLLAYALWSLDNSRPFPGYSALYPCGGAALLIIAGGAHSRLCRSILANAPMMSVGLISYSLYLWHWPILAFIRYFYGTVSSGWGAVALIVTIVLSLASYLWVELPARRWRGRASRQVIWLFVVPALVVVAVSVTVTSSGGFESLFSTGHERRIALDRQTAAVSKKDYPCQVSRPTSEMASGVGCMVGNKGSSPPSIVLWGDSHAGHYIGVLRGVLEHQQTGFSYLAVPTCPPVFGPGDFGAAYSRASCRRARDAFQDAQARAPAATVVLAGQWSVHERKAGFADALRNTIQELQRNGSHVVLLAQVPLFPGFGRECDLRWSRLGNSSCAARAMIADKGQSRPNRKIATLAAETGATLLDPRSLFCSDGVCSPYVDGKPVYFNESHLSRDGAYQLGVRLAHSSLFGQWKTVLSGTRIIRQTPSSRQSVLLNTRTKQRSMHTAVRLPNNYEPSFRHVIRSARRDSMGKGRYRHVVILEYLDERTPESLGDEIMHGLKLRGMSLMGPVPHQDGLRYIARARDVYLTVDIRARPSGVTLKAPGARGIVYFGWKGGSSN